MARISIKSLVTREIVIDDYLLTLYVKVINPHYCEPYIRVSYTVTGAKSPFKSTYSETKVNVSLHAMTIKFGSISVFKDCVLTSFENNGIKYLKFLKELNDITSIEGLEE